MSLLYFYWFPRNALFGFLQFKLLIIFLIIPHLTRQEGFLEAAEYLAKFGYLNASPAAGDIVSKESFIHSIKEFQKFIGLEVTGELDATTLKAMKTPRCGVKDKESTSDFRKRRYVIQGSYWKNKHLTYRISKYTEQLRRNEVDEAIRGAFDHWSKASAMIFTRKDSGPVDIDIRFERRDHGDGNPFDGPVPGGVTLAHAYFPGNGIGGDAHFDNDEGWSMTERGQNLLQVATHEFGHSLGLSHSEVDEAVMAPMYTYKSRFSLHRDDVLAVQSLYGPRKDRPEPPKPAPPPPPPPPSPRPGGDGSSLCKDPSIEAIFQTTDRRVYVFKGENYWEIVDFSLAEGYPKRISSTWKGLPGNIDAAFTHKNKRTYFFKGSQYWRFRGTEMEPGYPKSISETFPGIPNDIDSAMFWGGNEKVYFFKGTLFWRFDPKANPPVKSTYPKSVSNLKGMPNEIDAVFTHPNGFTYFFKDNVFYRLNDRKLSVDDVQPPYPRKIKEYWYGC